MLSEENKLWCKINWENATKTKSSEQGSYCVHPSPKVMADFFQTQKLTWCPYPICTIFGGCLKCMQVFIFCARYIKFLHQPVLHRGSKCGKHHFFFKSSLNIIVNFLLKFDGFKWNFQNFKLDTLPLSHQYFMAIGLTVAKPSANKCRSLCKLISNSMHANLGQTNDRIAMK